MAAGVLSGIPDIEMGSTGQAAQSYWRQRYASFPLKKISTPKESEAMFLYTGRR
jgi:hypothetical protein